jgi:hypothetical protein
MVPPPNRPIYASIEAFIAHYNPAAFPKMQLKKKGPARQKFIQREDDQLRELVAELGENNWADVAARLGTRSARQCRERYRNYLSPNLLNGQWTEAEDTLLIEKHSEFGAKWSTIVSFFPTRSEVNIKNRWTQLSSKSNRDHDLEQEKFQVIKNFETVITAPEPLATPKPKKDDGPDFDRMYDMVGIDWVPGSPGGMFDFFGKNSD